MKATSAANDQARAVGASYALLIAACAWQLSAPQVMAGEEECQNQAKIDVCKAGCTVTSDACRALCDFTSGACWVGCQAAFGTCDAGCDACDLGCDACCATTCFPGTCEECRAGCRSCHDDCDDARDDCEAGCRLDCDECILDCEEDCESICRPFKKAGEFCTPVVDRCASGLVCWPLPFPGEARPRCFPDEEEGLFPDEECRALYSSALHEGAIDTGLTMSYGSGSTFAAGVITVNELGTVYSPDGRYGCYVMSCLGGIVDVEVGVYAAIGFFTSYDDFRGESIVFSKEAGGEVIAFATSQIINTSGDLIGTADALSFEASVVPIFTAGVFDCSTIVDTVGLRDPSTGDLIPVDNSPPTAVCKDVETCADPVQCDADVSIDDGSTDPDGDALSLTQQPPAPYGIGEHTVTLTATDGNGESHSCSGSIVVNDCDAPEITCPEPITVDCEGDGGTVLDPGMALVMDCTEVMLTEPGQRFFPVGTTQAMYSAVDAAGNEASCETPVTVLDEEPPVMMEVLAMPDVLWPPNNHMRRVTVQPLAVDECDAELDCEVIEVVSDEPAGPGNGNGNGNGPKDFQLVGDLSVMLRADRDGEGDGRVYTLTVECRDGSGNAVQGEATVTVPHDQRHHKSLHNGHGRGRGQ